MKEKVTRKSARIRYTNTNPRKPFKPCQLVDYNGDVSKYWQIVYYVWDELAGKLVRKRFNGGINKHHERYARYEAALKHISILDQELYRGNLTIGPAKVQPDPALSMGRRFLLDVADEWIRTKQPHLREKSVTHYRHFVNNLRNFLHSQGLSRLTVKDLNQFVAGSFLKWLTEELKYSSRTYNNMLTDFRVFISWMLHQNRLLYVRHPLDGLKKLPTRQRKHKAYSLEQMKKIKEECLKQNDHQLLLFIEFIFYTLVRPGIELRFLKLKHIQEDRLYIPGETSKSRRDDYVTIPLVFRKKIQSLGLDQYDPEYYLFTIQRKPGPVPVGKHYFLKRFYRVAEALSLKKGHDIYSFKHSGAIHMYLAEIPLDKIKEQCRHTSIDQTLTYLRDLDVFRDSSAYDAVKGF